MENKEGKTDKYYKLTIRYGGGENDIRYEYYNDLATMCGDSYSLGAKSDEGVIDAVEISEQEYQENHLPI